MVARRIRRRVLVICDAWLTEYEKRKQQNKNLTEGQDWEQEEKRLTEEKYWVLATKAEACVGLGDDPAAQEPFNEAKAMAPASYMVESTETQMANLKKLLAAVKIAD